MARNALAGPFLDTAEDISARFEKFFLEVEIEKLKCRGLGTELGKSLSGVQGKALVGDLED